MGELLVILMNFWNGLGAFEKLAAGGGLVFASTFFRFITEFRGIAQEESGADSAMMVVRSIIKAPRAPLPWVRIHAACRSGRTFK